MRVGCDIVSIERIERIAKRHNKNFLDKFLSADEQNLLSKQVKLNFSTLAGFWAAKEAASKALGVGISKECGFLDIQISKDERNAPKLDFSKRVLQNFSIKAISVSISHDNGIAMAVVVIV